MTDWPYASNTWSDPAIIWIGVPWTAAFGYLDANGAAIDLTGYTATARITANRGSGAALIAALATGGDGITLSDEEPNITLALTDAETTALAENRGAWLWITLTQPTAGDLPVLHGPCEIRYWGTT